MTKTLVVISAGANDPSSTAMMANRAASRLVELGKKKGVPFQVRSFEVRSLAKDIVDALVANHISPALQEALDAVRDADALVVSTPVYKAGASGLFTSFFQVLDNDVLIGTPVILAATAGTARHALVVDDQLRGLFAYMRAMTVPTSLFAAPEDWGSDLDDRLDRAAGELIALVQAGVRDGVRSEHWNSYQHSYGSAGGTELGIDLDTDLMRMAQGQM